MTTPGDRADPRHGDWLTALGAAADSAAAVATICFDLARVLGGVSSDEMDRDPLGELEKHVRAVANDMGSPPPELTAFIAALPAARETRNDLLHALRVRDGLHRRVYSPPRIREFFTVESLDQAHAQMHEAWTLGTYALYFDGGQSVQNWHAAGGS